MKLLGLKEIVAVTTVLKDKDGSAKEIVVNQDEGTPGDNHDNTTHRSQF